MAARRSRRSWFSIGIKILILSGLLFVTLKASHLLPPSPPTRALWRLEAHFRSAVEDALRKASNEQEAPKSSRSEEKPLAGEISIRWHPRTRAGQAGELTSPPFSDGLAETDKVPAAVRRAIGSTVRVVATSEPQLIAGLLSMSRETGGIGTVVWRDAHSALLVTAAHVLREGSPEISFGPGRPSVPVDLVARDDIADLALLRVSTRVLIAGPALELAGPEAARPGAIGWFPAIFAEKGVVFEKGVALGRPADVHASVVAQYGEERARLEWFVLSQPSRRGLSGTPVLSRRGKIAGILIGGVKYPQGPESSLIIGSGTLAAFLRKAALHEIAP